MLAFQSKQIRLQGPRILLVGTTLEITILNIQPAPFLSITMGIREFGGGNYDWIIDLVHEDLLELVSQIEDK